MIRRKRPDPLIIVYLDPGLTTGIALLDGDRFQSDQLGFIPTGSAIAELAAKHGHQLMIGMEDYRVIGNGGDPTYSLKVIGMVTWLAHKHAAVMLPLRASADRKLGDDDKLKRLGWWNPGHDHANDAANHLLSHVIRERWISDDMIKKAAGFIE